MNTNQSTRRLRFRNQAIKMGATAYTLRDNLLDLPGIIKVTISKRTGSLLVLFDQTKVCTKTIFNKIMVTLGLSPHIGAKTIQEAHKKVTGKICRSTINKGLLLTGAVSLTALAFSKKAHVVAGTAFVALVGLHLAQHKQSLIK